MTRCCPASLRNPAFDAPHVGDPLDVAFDAGVNLAFAIAAPTVPPRLTEHSRRMAQRIYRVADRVYCAVGYAIANIIFVVGDDGIVVVDATEAVSAAKRIYEDFCAIDPRHAGLPVKAVVYNNSSFGLITLEAEAKLGLPAYKQGIDFPNPDYAALARACGAVG